MSDALERLHALLKPKYRGRIHFTRVDWNALGSNSNSQIVFLYLEWARENPSQIHWQSLCQNTHPDAVELCLEHIPNVSLDHVPDRGFWFGLSLNSHPKASSKMLECIPRFDDNSEWLILRGMSHNSNPLVVETLLKWIERNVDAISCLNPHPKAVEFILKQIQKAKDNNRDCRMMCQLGANPNPMAVKVFLEWASLYPRKVDRYLLSLNTNIEATAFLLKLLHKDTCPTWEQMLQLSFKTNPSMVDYFLEITPSEPLTANLQYQFQSNPHLFITKDKMYVMHLWTTRPDHVIYRMPLELVRMITDFMP